MIETTEAHFGPVDILVNNAGITQSKSLLDTTLEDYRRILDVNQVSVFLGMKSVVPSMMKSGGGSIVNISSINGLVGGAIGYTDSKFAVRGMTKAAALEFAANNIRINSVHPGVIATPMILQGDTQSAVEEFAKHIPLKRVARPDEVSGLVLYLASDDSSYSTGSEFIVDGGIPMGSRLAFNRRYVPATCWNCKPKSSVWYPIRVISVPSFFSREGTHRGQRPRPRLIAFGETGLTRRSFFEVGTAPVRS